AAAVLLDESETHDGRAYDLTGPEAFTLAEAAEELSRVTGRPVVYVPETREEAYASRAGYGAQVWEVAGWVTSYEAIANGELAAVSDAVPTLTGHPAKSFTEFLTENPDSYRHLLPGG
ncbi:SDR family NAD(P)-dependent oxidoreductase, partial [Streptomyces sp. SID8455]|nr:SDR family NAD(P)-dependent oxidoreductase [Streptomyces sp. SID8455]